MNQQSLQSIQHTNNNLLQKQEQNKQGHLVHSADKEYTGLFLSSAKTLNNGKVRTEALNSAAEDLNYRDQLSSENPKEVAQFTESPRDKSHTVGSKYPATTI